MSTARPVRKGRDESGRSTAERLLDAALESFAARGFEATSLDDLAVDLGVRKQTILYYHRSKEALLAAVIDQVVAELVVAFDEAIAVAPASSDRAAVVVDTVFRLGAARPELLALLWQVTRLGAPASGHLAAGVQPMFEHLVRYLAGTGRVPARRSEQVRRAVLGVSARVLGLAVEVEMRRALGVEADLAWLRRRRADLLTELRAAIA